MANNSQPKTFAIAQVRGDTRGYKFQRTLEDETVIMEAPDKIFVTFKKSFNDKSFVFQKTLDELYMDEEGWWHFTITPEDTNNLPYGKYYGDIERIIADDVKTIARGTLTLLEEATWASNEGGNNG